MATSMKYISILILLLLVVNNSSAQQQLKVVSGTVKDIFSGEPLVGAHIRTDAGDGAITNLDGFFELKTGSEVRYLVVSYVSYRTDTVIVSDMSLLQNLSIGLETELIQETVVEGHRLSAPRLQDAGVVGITGATLDKLPTVLGEREIMRAVQLLPGVQSGSDGGRGIFVRGGGPDQNLILYEGAPVFNIAHLYGIFSVFNSDVIGKADLHKNHLPAAYGGRLASVLEVDSKTAPMDKTTGGMQVGMFSSKVHFSTPIVKDKVSFQSSVRTCYIGLLTKLFSEKQFPSASESGYIAYYFYDINTSIYARPSDKHEIEGHFFLSDDIYRLYEKRGARFLDDEGFRRVSERKNNLRWGNMTSSLRWKATINEQWKYQQDIYMSYYKLKSLDDVYRRSEREDTIIKGAIFNINNQSSILESGIRGSAIRSNNRHHFQVGYSSLVRYFNAGKGDLFEQRQGFSPIRFSYGQQVQRGIETDIYSEYSLRLNRFRLDIGGRLAWYGSDDGFKKPSFQPRFMAEWQIGSGIIWQMSGAHSVQNLHLLTSSAGSILNDIWVPANSFARPETSWQGGTGIRQQLPKGYTWSIDAFYRSLDNALEYKEGASYISFGRDWQRQVAVNGKGRAYGLEVFAAKTAGDLTAWVKYTFSRSERQFDDINRGARFPFKYDRPHDASIAINYQINKRIDLSMTWVYGTGSPFTLPSNQYPSLQILDLSQLSPEEITQILDGNKGEVRYYEARNNYRLKAFHHLDVGMNYRWNSQRAKHVFNFSVYNIYNRLNIFNVYIAEQQNDDKSFSLVYKSLSIMPILPSFSYAVTF